jgi:hypothetical protein
MHHRGLQKNYEYAIFCDVARKCIDAEGITCKRRATPACCVHGFLFGPESAKQGSCWYWYKRNLIRRTTSKLTDDRTKVTARKFKTERTPRKYNNVCPSCINACPTVQFPRWQTNHFKAYFEIYTVLFWIWWPVNTNTFAGFRRIRNASVIFWTLRKLYEVM